jgi:hypothetical protein
LDPEDIKLIYDPSSGNRRAIEDALKTKYRHASCVPTDTVTVTEPALTQRPHTLALHMFSFLVLRNWPDCLSQAYGHGAGVAPGAYAGVEV